MARQKKNPPKPYYSVVHDYNDSLKAYQEASLMLYNAVTSVLSLREYLSQEPHAQRMLNILQEHADNYRKAVHGDL